MTKRRIGWAVWLLAAGLLWLFENNAATLTLLLASLVSPCASILLARRTARRAALALRAPESCAKGAAVRVTAETNAPLTGELVCENRLTGETARAALTQAQNLTAGRCGTLRLRACARMEDAFGLWRSPELPCAETYVTVEPALFLPRVTLQENTTVIADSERYSQTRPGSDPSETFAVREYVPGDPIRQIHWKLSQKSDALMLRELGLPVVNRTLLVYRNVRAEGERIPPETADAMAEVFLSVSRALAADGCAHTAAFAENGRYLLTEVRGEAEFRALCTRFLTLAWEPDDGALARLLAETPYAHVAIVSAVMPPDAASFCRGNRVSVLTPDADAHVDGVFTVPFTPERYPDELQLVEL